MITTHITIDGRDHLVVTAAEGKALRRIHDQFVMGRQVTLGTDYSTGAPREDRPEYYEQIEWVTPPTEAEKDEALTILGIKL